jgi:hypothetical protein
MPTIKGQPAVRKIESTGQVIQAGMPRLGPEFLVLSTTSRPFSGAASFKKRSSAGALSFFSKHGVFESIGHGKYRVKLD